MEAYLKILLLLICLIISSAAQLDQRLNSVERQALLNLRAKLGISARNWHRKVNPCVNWTGVDCKNGHVVAINLSGLRRTRLGRQNPMFSVDPLAIFSQLSIFNSSGFLLPGPIPEWLGQKLNNLNVLDLRSSSISGSIPSSIGSLTKLNMLLLSNNSITGSVPVELGKLSSLSVLDFSQNSLTGQIPTEISALRNLSKLDLSSNYFSGGVTLHFSSLSSLKVLNLSRNSLSSPIPAQIGDLSQLQELDLGFNSFFGPLPNELRGLRCLRKMLVGNNELGDKLPANFFNNLSVLEFLVLRDNYFKGNLPDALLSIPKLKYLDLSGNNLTGGLPNLCSNNVTGSVYNFSNNQFYGNLTLGTGKCHTIDVSNNYLEGLAPSDRGFIINLLNNCFPRIRGQRSREACAKFYSGRGRNDTVQTPLKLPREKHSTRFTYIMIGVFGGIGLMMILILGILLLMKVCNSGSTENQRGSRDLESAGEGNTGQPPKVVLKFANLGEAYKYEQLLLATRNFSTEKLIKQGHSGDLFRGTLENGQEVVIKRVDLRSVRNESFMVELEMFGNVSHPRLVPLLGRCLEDEHVKFLVYKYMPNGDLSNAMYRLTNSEDVQSLDWITRLKIATGAAEALSYLHHECNPPLVHRDIEASSILLDDKYEVRLGSFSEVCTPGTNNRRNVITRLLRTPQTSGRQPSGPSSFTCAYDVYCFGKVLLELVTGRIGTSRLSDGETKEWLDSNLPFISVNDKELVNKIVDQSLIVDEDLLEEVWAVALVAKSCLNPKTRKRPSMRQIVKALENPFKVVREENSSSGRLKTASSRQFWASAFYGSWHRSSSDSSNKSGQIRQSEKGSRGSGVNDHSSSHKRSSSDVFPEPVEVQDGVERQDGAR